MKTRLALPFVLLLLALAASASASAPKLKFQPLPRRGGWCIVSRALPPTPPPCVRGGGIPYDVPPTSSGYAIVGVRTVIRDGRVVSTTAYRAPTPVQKQEWEQTLGHPEILTTHYVVEAPAAQWDLGSYPDGLIYEQWAIVDKHNRLLGPPSVSMSLRLPQHLRIQKLADGVRITGEFSDVNQGNGEATLQAAFGLHLKPGAWRSLPHDNHVWYSQAGLLRDFSFTLKTAHFVDGSSDILYMRQASDFRASVLVSENGHLLIKSERVTPIPTDAYFVVTRNRKQLTVKPVVPDDWQRMSWPSPHYFH